MSDCRVWINGHYVDPSDFEGPSDDQRRAAERKFNHERRRSSLAAFCNNATTNMQGSANLRDRSPRTGKYSGGAVEGVRIK